MPSHKKKSAATPPVGTTPQSAAALSKHLRKLASEAHSVTDDGTVVTREEALAALIWKQALGWTESIRGDDGKLQKIWHPPVAWSQQYLFERIEGKAQVTQEQVGSKMTAKETVGELAKQRLNALAKVSVGTVNAKPV